MLLSTRKQIKEKQQKIQVFLGNFMDSEKPEEQFFVDAMPYILKSDIVYCPEINGEIVGIGYIFRIMGIFPNLGMVVKPAWQGKGIGQNIMEVALLFTKLQNGHLWSCLWDDNFKIIQLHLKNGFRKYTGSRGIGWYGVSYGIAGAFQRRVIGSLLPVYEFLRKRIKGETE